MSSNETETSVEVALEVTDVTHRYGEKVALQGLNLSVPAGQIFAILGPNGSGKTTLFRLISTLARVQEGTIEVFGHNTLTETATVRGQIGIVFQSPSLDPKLTVAENVACQAALYGLRGAQSRERQVDVLQQMGLTERANDRCENLSGGLKRRVELAKGMLHRPRLLLLDEPSTGLDPAARLDLWHSLSELRHKWGVTVILTTHLLEEADKADRIGIFHAGKVVALDTPYKLRESLGGDILSLDSAEPRQLKDRLASEFGLEGQVVQNQVRLTTPEAARWMTELAPWLGTDIRALSIGKPSLEDVFVARTGHRFWEPSDRTEVATKRKKSRH